MKQMFSMLLLGVSALTLGVLSGCKSKDDFRQERAEKAMKHFERSRFQQAVDGKRLSLKECIELAQRHNLALKVEKLEQQVAREQKTAEMLGMLPELNISNTYTSRNNQPASSSKKIGENGLSYGYSTSSDKEENVFTSGIALATLDFGLAFFNTVQAKDRELMQAQRVRRTSQNLTLDVVKAYFKVASAQRAISITRKLLRDCRDNYQLIEKLAKSRAITPFRAFDETRKFMDMEKRLTNYIRNYENSCVELRSLIGLAPAGQILVDDSSLSVVPQMEFPELILMEQIALLERPELYEADIRKHINVVECRKELIKMIPSARMFVDFNHNDNPYLYNNTWYSIGVNAAYNLLKLPKDIANYVARSSVVDAEAEKAYSLGIGIMAQVRICHFNLRSIKERFAIDDRVYSTYKKNLAWAVVNRRIAGELSRLELDRMKLETAEKEIERLVALGNVYVAHFQMLNALGVSKIDSDSVEVLKNELATARLRAEGELAKAEANYNTKLSGADKKQAEENKKVFDLINQPLTTLGNPDYVTVGL